MFKSIVAVAAIVCLLFEVCGATERAKAVDNAPNSQAFEQLLPGPMFGLGMPVPVLEKIILSRYPDWKRSDRKRAFNNRKDVALTPNAQSPYLQAISISYEDKTLGITRKYDFALTSPLSDSRVYSIVYMVQANTGGLIPIGGWADELHSRWGGEHGGMRSKTRARTTYFFDAEWHLVENGGDKCAPVYPALYRLDEKPIEDVTAAANLLEETECAFSRDNFVTVRNGIIVKSTFYTVDLQRGVDDVARRVVFGLR